MVIVRWCPPAVTTATPEYDTEYRHSLSGKTMFNLQSCHVITLKGSKINNIVKLILFAQMKGLTFEMSINRCSSQQLVNLRLSINFLRLVSHYYVHNNTKVNNDTSQLCKIHLTCNLE